jgi:predicted transcriptional regulator
VLVFPNTYTKEYFMSQTLLAMAKDLVMAQITAHRLSPEDMHQALQQTYATVQALKAQEDANGSITVVTPKTPPERVNWRKNITKHVVTCLECGASFKQLSVRHLREHELDGRLYRVKYGIPRTQSLAAKEITSKRKQLVQRSRPWEKAPTFVKAQEKAHKAVAQRKRAVRKKGTTRAKA